MPSIKGNKTTGSARYDYVGVELVDDQVLITASDGYFRERATASMSVKDAAKFLKALQTVISEASA